MTEKKNLLVIIASGEREKVLTAIMYALNTAKYGWLGDVKVMFFGPSEKLLINDEEVGLEAQNLATQMEPIACKFLSDRDEISSKIDELGITVDYVGSKIADLVNEGYVPMVW
ncbi:MAG: hypothetical protein P1Q69_13495 [Candidatus Thorarchaeota archaeon]|nr:hypothetical protein [Candidatus Thorarchaeota archaeon]